MSKAVLFSQWGTPTNTASGGNENACHGDLRGKLTTNTYIDGAEDFP